MRETCARVLAAALMTGAIATVVAMSALFDTPREAGRELTAPPSSLERSVRVTVRPAPRHAPVAPRPVVAHTNPAPPAPVVVSHEIVRRTVVRPHRTHHHRELASAVKPKPAPTVAPATLVLPAEAPPPAAPAATTDAVQDAESRGKSGEEHGHGNGHDGAHGHGHEEHED
jgi:hypothetical protein